MNRLQGLPEATLHVFGGVPGEDGDGESDAVVTDGAQNQIWQLVGGAVLAGLRGALRLGLRLALA